MKLAHPGVYKNDEDAFDDFVITNWAVVIKIPYGSYSVIGEK